MELRFARQARWSARRSAFGDASVFSCGRTLPDENSSRCRRVKKPKRSCGSPLHLRRSGEPHERFGFFTRLHLEEFSSGRVLPHEKTLASPKADRLALQRACRANLSSIFGLYSAPGFSLVDAVRT